MSPPSGSDAQVRSGGQRRSPDTFFADALEVFERAVETVGECVERFFRIAGYEIRMRFAGPAMTPLARAFAHRSVAPSSSPDLTVCLWDSDSTDTLPLRPGWPTDSYGAQGLVDGYNTERFRTALERTNNTLHALDHERSTALCWIPRAADVTYYETISPLRTLLNWWMGRNGRHFAHAAAVGRPGGGVLIPARGGSGKSTTALLCLDAGMLYVGDNNVLLEGGPGGVTAHGVYCSTSLHAGHLQGPMVGFLPLVENRYALGEQKGYAYLDEPYGDRLVPSLPIRAVLVPRLTGRPETRVVKGSVVESLHALLPSTVFSFPGAGRSMVEALTSMMKELPHHVLELGTELKAVPGVISAFLERGW